MENANITFIIEMIAVCTFALTGLLFQFHAWPHPWFLLAWAGVIFVGFSVYRGATYAHRRSVPAAAEAIGASVSGTEASGAQASASGWSADDPSEVDPTVMQPAADMVHPPLDIQALSAAFEAAELRRETHLDLVEPDAGPLPAFAESTLTVKQREQTLRTLLKDIGELKDPRESVPTPVEPKVESPASPLKPLKPVDREDTHATLLQPMDNLPTNDSPRQPDPADDATLLRPIAGPPKKDLSKKDRPKNTDAADASDIEDMRATVRAPLQALKEKALQKKARSQETPAPPKEFDPRATVLEPGRAHGDGARAKVPSKNRSAQIGRRVQFLGGDALDELRQRAATLDPPTPAKDDE